MKKLTKQHLKLLKTAGIKILPSWIIYPLARNIFVVENRLRCSGTAQHERGERRKNPHRSDLMIIWVRKSMTDVDKALTIEHERAHLIQFLQDLVKTCKMDKKTENEYEEKVAYQAEDVFIELVRNYPPYIRGIEEIYGKVPGMS